MPTNMSSQNPIIGTLNEGDLHSSLKNHFSLPNDKFEFPIESYVIDIYRSTNEGVLLIEIQTSSFASMRKKLTNLLDDYRIRVVFPIAEEIVLVKPGHKERKSPKKETMYSIFQELVSIPDLLTHENLSFDLVEVSVKKIKEYDPQIRRRRGGFRTVETVLSSIHGIRHFAEISDFMQLIPTGLPPVFTTADISKKAGITRTEAQQMAYCFRHAGIFLQVGNSKVGKEYEMA